MKRNAGQSHPAATGDGHTLEVFSDRRPAPPSASRAQPKVPRAGRGAGVLVPTPGRDVRVPTEGRERVGRQPAERRLLFSSRGKWLHPLFELEEFLRREGLDPGGLLIRDKIVGKAAAMLIVRMGFRRLEAGILSRPGRTVLDTRGIHYLYGELVERILCQTETVLENTWDLEEAYRIVRERAGRGPGRP